MRSGRFHPNVTKQSPPGRRGGVASREHSAPPASTRLARRPFTRPPRPPSLMTRGLQAAGWQAPPRLPFRMSRGIQFHKLALLPHPPSPQLSAMLRCIGVQPPAGWAAQDNCCFPHFLIISGQRRPPVSASPPSAPHLPLSWERPRSMLALDDHRLGPVPAGRAPHPTRSPIHLDNVSDNAAARSQPHAASAPLTPHPSGPRRLLLPARACGGRSCAISQDCSNAALPSPRGAKTCGKLRHAWATAGDGH